jgi:hypothetical protein
MPLSGCRQPPRPSACADGSQPVGSSTQRCAAPLPDSLAADCAAAPKAITLPRHVHKAMQTSYEKSFPDGRSQERGGTLVRDAAGQVSVVHESSGTSGTFSPKRSVASGEQVIGTYHTHPYDESEGGHKGVSFSGADIAYAHHHQEPVYVDAGNKQFMITPTAATPSVSSATLNSDWDAEFSRLLGEEGKSLAEASQQATNTVAQRYNMAYYEGEDGVLKKVSC